MGNLLLVLFAVSPVIYIQVVAVLLFSAKGFSGKIDVFPIFLGLLAYSAADLGVLVYTQTSSRFLGKAGRGPLWRAFQTLSIGGILSVSLATFGLVLSLLSLSIIYVIGFSATTWVCLLWVRSRYDQNMECIPD